MFRCGNSSQESSIPLGTTIRELLTRKKAGNEAFQSGKFAEALDHYNTAISCSVESLPFAAICFCNRAAAHQSLGQIIDAIADCSVAMALDENYTKAASRRATLHEMIRDYEHAVTDLQRLISLLENQEQRSNGSNLKELRKARQRLSSVEEKAKSEIPLDLYLILGIKASDPESDIKKAYKKAALKHHPDKAAQFLARSESMDDGQLWKDTCEKVQKDADRLFKMIGEAYAVLSDSDKVCMFYVKLVLLFSLV
nr:DnaJ homolog subfamily C member 7-like isoform X1 [Ipomoea batatas]GME12728.1 DnaJ homolog subfamily C member 7-like isoform X1 [Ipomoea batatas]